MATRKNMTSLYTYQYTTDFPAQERIVWVNSDETFAYIVSLHNPGTIAPKLRRIQLNGTSAPSNPTVLWTDTSDTGATALNHYTQFWVDKDGIYIYFTTLISSVRKLHRLTILDGTYTEVGTITEPITSVNWSNYFQKYIGYNNQCFGFIDPTVPSFDIPKNRTPSDKELNIDAILSPTTTSYIREANNKLYYRGEKCVIEYNPVVMIFKIFAGNPDATGSYVDGFGNNVNIFPYDILVDSDGDFLYGLGQGGTGQWFSTNLSDREVKFYSSITNNPKSSYLHPTSNILYTANDMTFQARD